MGLRLFTAVGGLVVFDGDPCMTFGADSSQSAVLVTHRQALAAGANIATQPCWVAKNETIVRHIPCHHTASPNHRPPANRDATSNCAIRSNGRAIFHAGLCHQPIISTLQTTIRINGAWLQIIGETDMRADEDAILDDHAVIHRYVVLQLATIANSYAGIDVNPFAKDAIFANVRVFPDLDMVPDAGVVADEGVLGDFGCGMDSNGHL